MALCQPPKIISVLDLLKESRVKIPEYQRPYKWTIKNVNQLVDDILLHKSKSAYRIGTIVMHHDNNDVLNIVDGQQRSLTLALIAYAIGKHFQEFLKNNKELSKINFVDLNLLKLEFNNDTTLYNIHNNYHEIVRRIGDFDTDSISFFFEKCELVQVVLSEVSEAFQFFDSQNARGKDLEPHDLLKAYHLREMRDETEQQKIETVITWEAMKSDELARFFENYLFRIRQWSKGRKARYFTKNEVSIFKGINLNSEENYAFAQLYRIGHFYTDNYNRDFNRNIDLQEVLFPFQIDQIIINGRRFFEMVTHYRKMTNRIGLTENQELKKNKLLSLIQNDGNNSQAKEILKVLNTYPGRFRTGDEYVRTLFECALLYYIDRFGEIDLSIVIEKVFYWSYRLRMKQQAVQLASMDNFALEDNIFRFIKESLHPSTIRSYKIDAIDNNISTKTEEIEKLFKRANYVG